MSDLLSRCTAFLLAQQYDAYLVGGTVRDQAMGRDSHDIDLVAPSGALLIARKLADHLGGAYFPLDAERETGRIVLPDHSVVDVSRLRGSNIAADLAARDFTINAMARRLSEPENLIDPHAGLRDLREKRLRAVSDQVFADDPARLLRAVRLAAELELAIEPDTAALIGQNAGRVAFLAGERARDELLRIFQRGDAADSVRALARLGLLAYLLPHATRDPASLTILNRLGALAGHASSPSDPAALDTVDRLGTLPGPAAHPSDPAPSVIAEFQQLLAPDLLTNLDTGQTNPVVIKLAALYNDPQSVVTDLGALRFRRDEIYYARMLVAGHGRVGLLPLPVAPLDAHRFFRDTGSRAGRMGLLLLALAEAPLSAVTDRAELVRQLSTDRTDVVRQLLRYYRDSHDQVIAPTPLINGAELAARFGLQGHQIGDGLRLLLEAQVQGAVHTVADAERFFQQDL